MTGERRRAHVTEGLEGFVADGAAVSVHLAADDDEGAARLARAAVELAAAANGAALVLTRRSAAGAALRNARDLRIEPRILSPLGGAGVSARTPLTLALQGDRALPAFSDAAAFIAEFVAHQAAVAGAATDGALRGKVAASVAKARERSKAGLDFAAIARQVAAALGPSHPALAGVKDALRALDAAESAAKVFASPASWATLLEPAPAGRRGAAFVDLAALGEETAELVLSIALASLAGSLRDVGKALGGGPVFLVADAPRAPLGRFAADKLASWGLAESPALFAIFLSTGLPAVAPAFPEARFDEAGLHLPGRDHPLPVPPAPHPLAPLGPAEAAGLTPLALRARLLGGPTEHDEEEEEAALGEPASTPEARESYRALREVAGDLEAIARKRVKPAAKEGARGATGYEASDFELK